MKKNIFILGLFFISVSLFSQNSADSILDFILNDYLLTRVQTKNLYIENRTNSICLSDSLYGELLKKDTIYRSQPWNELLQAFDSLNNKENLIRKKNFNYKFISKRKIRKELDIITYEQGISFKDPLYNWKKFKLKHQDCDGIVTLSYLAVSEDKNEFIIYVDFYNASDKGFGDLIFGRKQDEKWMVLKEVNFTQNLTSRIVTGD